MLYVSMMTLSMTAAQSWQPHLHQLTGITDSRDACDPQTSRNTREMNFTNNRHHQQAWAIKSKDLEQSVAQAWTAPDS